MSETAANDNANRRVRVLSVPPFVLIFNSRVHTSPSFSDPLERSVKDETRFVRKEEGKASEYTIQVVIRGTRLRRMIRIALHQVTRRVIKAERVVNQPRDYNREAPLARAARFPRNPSASAVPAFLHIVFHRGKVNEQKSVGTRARAWAIIVIV